MFELSVLFASGNSRKIELRPEMTVAEIRGEIEKEFDSFVDVRLFQSTRELLDEAKIEVVLQAVPMKSPTKALDALEDQYSKLEVVDDAIAMLNEVEELDPMHCERLWEIICVNSENCVYAGEERLRIDKLCMIFGRACGNPAPYIARLVDYVCMNYAYSFLSRGRSAAIAGFEIVRRCGDSMPNEFRIALMIWAEGRIREILPRWQEQAYKILDLKKLKLVRHDNVEEACKLLGLLSMEARHISMLKDVRATAVVEQIQACESIAETAAEAIRLICLRIGYGLEELVDGDDDVSIGGHSEEEEEESEEESEDEVSVEEMAAHLEETEPDLEQALHESEQAVLLRYQEDLTKTILVSKTDCQQRHRGKPQDGVEQPNGLVLLCFQSCRKELYKSLLESPMAVQLAADGVLLQPDFAAGRLILAKGVTEAAINEARGPWHVAVRVADESKVYSTLRECLGRQRPRLMKEDGRFLVPDDLSLFDDASSGSEATVQPQWWDVLDIKRTFLHPKIAPKPLARRAVSAPPPTSSRQSSL